MFYLQDLRYALRQLGLSLAFTTLTVVVLAGGLSVSTVMIVRPGVRLKPRSA